MGYPFARPGGSYIVDPATGAVGRFDLDGDPVDGRIPVLAVGSNAAPEQLRHKFGAAPGADGPIPVTAVAVNGLDSVYAAQVARYGAIPATVQRAPGVTAQLHVTWLTDEQLARMNVTEAVGIAYELEELTDVRAVPALPGGEPLRCYCAISGALTVDGQAVPLAAIVARGRELEAWDEPRMLGHVAARFELTIEEFVMRVADDSFRTQVNNTLSETGLPW